MNRNEEPSVSVVIPVHNGAHVIGDQLRSVVKSLRMYPSSEVLVVNNNSTDDLATAISALRDTSPVPIRLLTADGKEGEPYARNVGWRAAYGDLILFCDADDEVSDLWASALVEALAEGRYATGPLRVDRLNEPHVVRTRGHALFRELPFFHGLVPFAHGANMGFERGTLAKLGGFNESFLIGCDIELAVRAWRGGVDLDWVPGAVVDYRLRSTPTEVFHQARAYGHSRRDLDSLLPEARIQRSKWRNNLRRAAWLTRHSLFLIRTKRRLEWLWVAGQLVGEME